MPYTHYTPEERNALQVMEALKLPRYAMAVTLGKHISRVYRELARNAEGGLYTATLAQRIAERRRTQTKPCPKIGSAALMKEVREQFKEDWSLIK